MDRQWIILLHKDVQRSIIRGPGVLVSYFCWKGRHVQQLIQTTGTTAARTGVICTHEAAGTADAAAVVTTAATGGRVVVIIVDHLVMMIMVLMKDTVMSVGRAGCIR